MKTLIIGLGNPLLGDDSVGWRVAELVQKRLENKYPDVEVDCLAVGGLSLMERLVGSDRAILIDSLTTGQSPVGTLLRLELEDLPNLTAEHMTNAHDTSLQTALKLGRSLGVKLPEKVMVVGIEAKRVYDFSEALTPAVTEAIPRAVELVFELLSSWGILDRTE
jgi:hydrogenase maturation protease